MGEVREYARDPAGVLDEESLLGTLDVDADLPAGSEETGYELPTAELWFGPDSGDTYAYIVKEDGTVERWPRTAGPDVACA